MGRRRGRHHRARPHPSILVEELDGELVLFDPRTARAVHLNAAASAVWQGLTAGSDRAAAAGSRGDIARLLRRLGALGLLG